jgi:transposase
MLCYRLLFRGAPISAQAHFKLVLDKFLEWTETAYKLFPKSCRTISRWIEEILAYFDRRTTQGIVEGINLKIQMIKRRAYGLTNFNNFRRRILLNWYFCS